MKVFITGICGFVGRTVAEALAAADGGLRIAGLDNFARPGSRSNLDPLRRQGIPVIEADIRDPTAMGRAVAATGGADWIVDAAANPSAVAGLDARSPSRDLVDNNLLGTINVLEHCKAAGTGLILISSSRVYAVEPLAGLDLEIVDGAFQPRLGAGGPVGLSRAGVTEAFSSMPPLSLYGACKLASEIMALEYGRAFGFPVWIDRCGVLAGAGQFGVPDQGIFAYWINAWRRAYPLRYIGFAGTGHQVRDCLHPRDLIPLFLRQMREPGRKAPSIVNVGGGVASAMSLKNLSAWCERRFGPRAVGVDPGLRPFDLPWMVLDATLAERTWDWRPATSVAAILEEIAVHAEAHPDWLTLSGLERTS